MSTSPYHCGPHATRAEAERHAIGLQNQQPGKFFGIQERGKTTGGFLRGASYEQKPTTWHVAPRAPTDWDRR
jgi:hypothetical protein